MEYVKYYVNYFTEHTLALVPIDDGLKHRPRAEWSIMYMNCDLTDAEIWLQSALQEENSEKEVYIYILNFCQNFYFCFMKHKYKHLIK